MKNRTLIALLSLGLICPASAQLLTGQRVVPLGFCQFTATSSSQTLSAASCPAPAAATMVVITIEAANVRYRDDGTAPTTAVGTLIIAAAVPYVYTGNPGALQIIAVSGSPVVDLTFYRLAG